MSQCKCSWCGRSLPNGFPVGSYCGDKCRNEAEDRRRADEAAAAAAERARRAALTPEQRAKEDAWNRKKKGCLEGGCGILVLGFVALFAYHYFFPSDPLELAPDREEVEYNEESDLFQIYVTKDRKMQYGPFSVEQLRQYVKQGDFTTKDLVCHDGKNWVTVGEFLGILEFPGGSVPAGDNVSPF